MSQPTQTMSRTDAINLLGVHYQSQLESLSLRRALWHGQRTPRRSVRQRGASDATQKIAGGADSAPTMGQNDSKEVV